MFILYTVAPLLYRMASTEPGVAMPELGRTVPHAEGVQLIRDWIAAGAPQRSEPTLPIV